MRPYRFFSTLNKKPTQLLTGNFSYFTHKEKSAINISLNKGHTLVLLYDRDNLDVPANERATWIRRHFNHHSNLEVRVAYGPPDLNEASNADFANYIKQQIPNNLQVSSVNCNHPYSLTTAELLQTKFNGLAEMENNLVSEAAIKSNPSEHRDLLSPCVAKRVISPFNETIDEQNFKLLCDAQTINIREKITDLNPNHPNKDTFFQRTTWDLTQLNQINLPIIIGNVACKKHQKKFSYPYAAQVFDMPIYMPGQGWQIPTELSPFKHVFAKIVAAESASNPAIDKCNAYVTIDSGLVYPNCYARREGLHVDGFLTNANAFASDDGKVWGDNTYIISDSQTLQTEIYPGPFDLSGVYHDTPQAVLAALAEQGKGMPYQQFNAYDIVKMTTNHVHAVHPNLTDTPIQRSFLKMTFSERLFNRGGNTVNPSLHYRFIYVPRSKSRNTQNFIGQAPLNFTNVHLNEINFNKKQFPSWVDTAPLTVYKNPDVRVEATPAKEGEALATQVNDQVITTNVARAGDMKIKRTNEDQYFLGANFYSLYHPTGQKNTYAPTERKLKAVKVKSNITFPSLWGTRQNIPAGGYIIEDSNGDKWGVAPQSFAATYKAS